MVSGAGGGGGGGAFAGQLLALLTALASIPPHELLRIGVGLLLIVIILMLLRRSSAPQPAPVSRTHICLICGQPLPERAYVDRYVPGWVACENCYASLPPEKQRQYQPRRA